MQDESILDTLYDALAASAQMALLSNLIGSPPPVTKRRYAFLHAPDVGALVMEASSYYRRSTHRDAIGTLERVEREPIDLNRDEKWDEEAEGRPVPRETVYYIRTLDGREMRWVNADFIRVLRNDEERRRHDL